MNRLGATTQHNIYYVLTAELDHAKENHWFLFNLQHYCGVLIV